MQQLVASWRIWVVVCSSTSGSVCTGGFLLEDVSVLLEGFAVCHRFTSVKTLTEHLLISFTCVCFDLLIFMFLWHHDLPIRFLWIRSHDLPQFPWINERLLFRSWVQNLPPLPYILTWFYYNHLSLLCEVFINQALIKICCCSSCFSLLKTFYTL